MNTRKTKCLLGFFFCMAVIVFSGCSIRENKKIRQAVSEELNQLKSSDTESIQNCIRTQNLLPASAAEENTSQDIADIVTLFYKDFSFRVKKIQVKDNKASAHTELCCLDAKSLAKDFCTAALKKRVELDASPEEVEFTIQDSYLLLKNLLETKKYKMISSEFDIDLKKKKDTWEVIHTAKLDRTLTGDFQSYVTDPGLLSPTEIVQAHFDTIKNFDAEQLKTYLSLDTLFHADDAYNTQIAQTIAEQIHQAFDFKITGENQQENQATVNASITSVKFESIIENYKSQLSQWLKTSQSLAAGADGRREKEQTLLLECIKNNTDVSTSDIQIQLVNDGINWKIQMDSNISQAIFGDIQNAVDSISDGME